MATKGFGALPVSTINPSKVGAQATDSYDQFYRPMQWMHNPIEENLQRPENVAALWTLLEKLPQKGNEWTNPTMHWRIEDRLNMFTSLTTALAANDTYLNVAEPLLLKTGYIVFLPQTGEQVLVIEVDPTQANGWTNNASVACNVKVDRSILAGPKLAAAAGTEVRAGVPLMGEFGAPKEGITSVPGDPQYNFIQLFGLYISISNMQRNSLMSGDWGTHERLVRENESYLSQQLQNTLLFGRRMAYKHPDEGMVYMTNGIIPQLKDNVLSAGSVGNTLTYANVSDFVDGTFESANSGSSKYIACGEQLYKNLHQTARQENAITDDGNNGYNPAIGVEEFSFKTGGGKNVSVGNYRFAFMGALKDWGTVLDLTNIATGAYKGFGWRWYMDLEPPMQAITKKTDALVASTAVTVKDPSTCGVIKGGVNPLIANRTGLGIVENY